MMAAVLAHTIYVRTATSVSLKTTVEREENSDGRTDDETKRNETPVDDRSGIRDDSIPGDGRTDGRTDGTGRDGTIPSERTIRSDPIRSDPFRLAALTTHAPCFPWNRETNPRERQRCASPASSSKKNTSSSSSVNQINQNHPRRISVAYLTRGPDRSIPSSHVPYGRRATC